MLFTSNLKFLSLLYLSSTSQLQLGCFNASLLALDPTFCSLSVVTAAIACIGNLVASATASVIVSLVFACSLAIFVCILCSKFAYVCLCEIFTTDTM